jgi:NAD(P)H-dependent FMN reductase
MHIKLILGTAREGRQSEKVSDFIKNILEDIKADFEFVDVRDYGVFATQGVGKFDWTKKAEEADAFIIVSPEYNHSFPGELKILLDSAYPQYMYKPVLLCGVSAGSFGGVRVVEDLRKLTNTVGMMPMPTAFNVSGIEKIDFNDTETKETYTKRFGKILKEFAWLGESLKKARNEKEA